MSDLDVSTGFGPALIRFGAAAVVGGIIGLNRELHDKPAGLRTLALVSLGAAIATSLGVEVTASGKILDMPSLTRVIQGVLTGVGFVGAGVIFRDSAANKVKGLTTAATIWVVAALGMACGVGRWPTVVAAAGITMIVLVAGGPLEKKIGHLLKSLDSSDAPPSTPKEPKPPS